MVHEIVNKGKEKKLKWLVGQMMREFGQNGEALVAEDVLKEVMEGMKIRRLEV